MRVLFATDGGEAALHALTFIERAAVPEKTEITVVTAAPELQAEDRHDPPSGPAGEIVTSAASRLQGAGFAVERRVLAGHPGSAVLEEIERGDYELAIAGAGNRSRLSRLLLGSVSTKILHTAAISALIVHRSTSPGTPVKVLFGTDGSESANLGVSQMVGLLNPATCSIKVVSVAEHLMPNLSFPIPRVGYATQAPTPEKEKEWIAAAERPARDAAKRLDEAGFETDVKVVLGAPTSHLLAEVDEMEADLVVVGARGLGAVERATLGSVSGQIVNESPATLVARS